MKFRGRPVAYVVLFLSGAAALGYQMAWVRLFTAGLGHEGPAMLAIVAAFMGGMGLGALLLNQRLANTDAPLRWYAVLEAIIGMWGLASIALIPLANELALRWIGTAPAPVWQWTVAFLIPALLLSPATAAIGATFQALERALSLGGGRYVAAVYGANTLGAVAGTLGATFLIAPRIGLSGTVTACAVTNLVCMAIALLLHRKNRQTEAAARRNEEPVGSARQAESSHGIAGLAFLTGLLGIAYEVSGTQVLGQVLENTVYTYAGVLSVFLLGTSAGAMAYARFSRSTRKLAHDQLLAAVAMACAIGLVVIGRCRGLYESVEYALGIAWAECAVAFLVFALPAATMGALFSHIVQTSRDATGRIGSTLALNTFGAACAPALAGVVLIPLLGSKWLLILIVAMYVAASFWARVTFVWMPLAAVIALVITAIVCPPTFHIVSVPAGGRLLTFQEGTLGAVAVVEDARGDRVLRVNNRFQMGGTAAADAEYRGAHIPLLLHPSPSRALFLGLGTGITVGGAVLHPGLTVDAVELIPEVVAAAGSFAPQNRMDRYHGVRIYTADARRFVRTTTNRYDVIVGDLFHPARDGAGTLYTVEHFRALQDRLAPGGLVCQWLPLHQLDEPSLRSIVSTFAHVFPHVSGIHLRFVSDAPVLGLIGSREPLQWSENRVERRLGAAELRDELKRLALGDTVRVLGQMVNVKPLQGGELNADNHPFITFHAPSVTYRGATKGYELLRRVLAVTDGQTVSLEGLSPEFRERVGAYVRARDIYLNGLIAEDRDDHSRAVEAYVESARVSSDFTTGYARCVSEAALLARSEPARARALLERLIAARPERPVARELLERLGR